MQGWNKMDENEVIKKIKEVQDIAERVRRHANELETKYKDLEKKYNELTTVPKNKKSKGE